MAAVESHWGEGMLDPINAPSMRNDKAFVQSFGRLERVASSPGGIQALFRADYENDARHPMPSIRVPTMILHRKDDSTIPVVWGHDMAQKIPGAKYVELPGNAHLLRALDQDVLDLLIDELSMNRGVHDAPSCGAGPSTRHRDVHRYSALHGARSRGGRLEMARAAQ
jgi:pimeloyl-ACP methyl ester carboxylesterase